MNIFTAAGLAIASSLMDKPSASIQRATQSVINSMSGRSGNLIEQVASKQELQLEIFKTI